MGIRSGRGGIGQLSLSSSRLPSSAAPKETRKEERRRKRKKDLDKELDEESDITLSDDSIDKDDSRSRKLSLSPTQFFDSKVTGALNRSSSKQQEASVDVPVEAVACVSASGVNSIQRDNQGHPQGSSFVSPPSPSYNLPPTENAQALNRSLAAELIQAGSGRSPFLPSKIKYPQEPGTAVSMIAPTSARRNNLNSSPQVQVDQRTVEELRLQAQADNRMVDELLAQAVEQTRVEQLRRFGEACKASVTEARESAESAQSELTTDRQRLSEDMEQTLAATRLRTAEVRNERRRLKEVAATRPAPTAPVIDMRFCIDNLPSLRIEAADHSLTAFSDYWAPDFPKTTPNKPNTFVPNHLLKPSNPLWEPFFDPGLSSQGADGSSQEDPNHPPFGSHRKCWGVHYTRSRGNTSKITFEGRLTRISVSTSTPSRLVLRKE
jgi:hypothetical protein